ncbi:hypothetical protein DCC61_00295 [Candidatus Microgenomates bacterium]|nr:hypothetical protein [Candidatus Microgenomates bacterium CPR3]RIK52214.1 MAG: hypothetical protein DCC61_00295 [Candidatus Microgenomates bacterium]
MKKFLLLAYVILTLAIPQSTHASISDVSGNTPNNLFKYEFGSVGNCDLSEYETDGGESDYKPGRQPITLIATPVLMIGGLQDASGKNCNTAALLPQSGKMVASLFQNGITSQQYLADIANNIGLPTLAPRAYAQGTGYAAMGPFLEFWKGFRNVAYALYIVMFVVVGIMIMLRTKINAQTVITIQAALPNLLITLLLITFSYAIVGFMIDIMYFLIYFLVYLLSTIGIIGTPVDAISRLLGGSAWSVIFSGRNSVIWAVAAASDRLLSGVGDGLTGFIGKGVAIFSPSALIAAVWLGVTMIKLLFVLVKAYVMLIIQTVTAPIQILMNAMPGSKAFSEWLKKTASYLLPFPVVAAMFIFAAILVGDPSKSTLWNTGAFGVDGNPFGIDSSSSFYAQTGDDGAMWLPPFTLTGTDLQANDLMGLIGFFIFTMTPAAAKMAMDWLQVKESPYTSEIGAGLGGAMALGKTAYGWKTSLEHQREATRQLDYQKQMAAGIKDLASKK